MTSFWTRIGFGTIRKLKLDVIDPNDRTFDVLRTGRTNLIPSLQAAGMAHPILVEPFSNHHYRILNGFHRYSAASSLRWKTVPARIIKPDASAWNAFKHIFWIEASRNDPHPAEWAGIIRIAKSLNLQPRPATDEILEPMGFPLSDHLFSLVRKLSDVPAEITDHLLRYPLSFRQVERLVLIRKEVLPKLAAWANLLRIRTQELIEIGEQLSDFISMYSVEEQQCWFTDIEARIVDTELPRDERLYHLKTQLNSAVRPKLHACRRKKQEVHRQLNLPKGIQVSWDENLERDDVNINISIVHPDELDEFQRVLTDPRFRTGITKLLSTDD
jgi:hypothetical protein